MADSITNRELISAYMRRVGRTYITNDANDLTPLLPFFILDLAYQLYLSHVLPLQCSHEARRWRSEWSKTYGKLNREFFSSFDDDQTDAVIDRMESLEAFVDEDINAVRKVVADYLAASVPSDKTETIAVCMVCNVLAQSASLIWEKVYRGENGQGVPNRDIERLVHATSAFLNSWHKPDRYVNCNDDEAVDSAIVKLQARIVAWLPVAKAWRCNTDSLSIGQT